MAFEQDLGMLQAANSRLTSVRKCPLWGSAPLGAAYFGARGACGQMQPRVNPLKTAWSHLQPTRSCLQALRDTCRRV